MTDLHRNLRFLSYLCFGEVFVTLMYAPLVLFSGEGARVLPVMWRFCWPALAIGYVLNREARVIELRARLEAIEPGLAHADPIE